MATRDKKATTNAAEESNNKRPEVYTPQQGHKATLSLSDFSDSELFAELRRRGFAGELRFSKVVMV